MDHIRPGARNDITDVAGIAVGHHQRTGRGWSTGTTVVLTPRATVGSVEVRGGGPATRETDALAPTTMVQHVDAVCLTGGSAYGLDAAGGVMAWLEHERRGFPVGPAPEEVVPIVPAAGIFDLGEGGVFANRPDATFGLRAARAARARQIRQGTVGAGTGARAGALKGGVGSASAVAADGSVVGALAVVNSAGSVVDPSTGELWGIRHAIGDEAAGIGRPSRADVREHLEQLTRRAPLNTTLVVVATSAALTKAECHRLAVAGHDGMARAIDPVHGYTDGDIVFALATGSTAFASDRPEPGGAQGGESAGGGDGAGTPGGAGGARFGPARVGELGPLFALAASTVTRAIVNAVLRSTSVGGVPSYLDRFPSARR